MQSMGPEQLFRLVLNTGETNLDVVGIAEQGAAFQGRMQSLVNSNPNLTQGVVAATAVAATAAVAYAAYSAMANRLDNVQDERENYQDMIDQGISTYFIPRERQKRHPWDHYVAAYVQALRDAQHPTLNDLVWRYAGIHQKTIDHEKRRGVAYGVMSAFATPLGAYFPQTADDSDTLTQARKSLNTFILGELKEKLLEVEAYLKPGWLTDIKLVTHAERFLPWLNATRILLISLGDLGSNALFSMNPHTNMPLSYQHSAEVCGLIRDVLGHMRSDMKNAFSEHRKDLCCAQSFDDFLAIFDSRILALKKAYEQSAENKLNINEVSNSMYLMLQQLITNLRALVYLNQPFSDPVHLNGKIIYLADLIYFHPDLVNTFIATLKLPKNFDYAAASVNNPPTTVIDILILWGNLSKERRRGALSAMLCVDTWQRQFIKTLRDIDTNFIRPIEKKSNYSYLQGLYHISKTSLGPAQLFLISSIAMSIEVYRLNLVEHRYEGRVGVNQQILTINMEAKKSESKYGWRAMLGILGMYAPTQEALVPVFESIYDILPLLKSADLMTLISEKNQRVANTDDFQKVLLTRLRHLLEKKKELLKAIKALIAVAEDEKKSDKDLLRILTSLDSTSSKTALSITQIAEEFDRAINHTIRMLEESIYDEVQELKEHEIIDMLAQIDDPELFSSQEAFEQFYKGLRTGIRSRNLLMVELEHKSLAETKENEAEHSLSSAHVETRVSASVHYSDKANFNLKDLNIVQPAITKHSEAHEQEKVSYAFQWAALSTWLYRASMFMLLLGFCLVLLMAFGTQTIPAIAALSTQVATGFVIGGLVSAAAGGFGLAATYYTPRLFKNKIRQDKSELSSQLEYSA